jgi:hypothetical protein
MQDGAEPIQINKRSDEQIEGEPQAAPVGAGDYAGVLMVAAQVGNQGFQQMLSARRSARTLDGNGARESDGGRGPASVSAASEGAMLARATTVPSARESERAGAPAGERNTSRRPTSGLSRLMIQRRGVPIPGGAIPVPAPTNSVDGSLVVTKLTSMGTSMWSGFDGFAGTPVERQIVNAFETSNLQPRSIAINWVDERGLNKVWTGTVNIRMENPTAIQAPGGAGTGTVSGGGGGTGTSGTSTSTANTSGASASATGSTSTESGSTTSGASATAGGSTSTTTTQGEAQGASGGATTGSSTTDTLQRYTCTIVADIFLKMEMDASGTDYINPFKWGMYAAEAVTGDPTRTDSVACGQWTYQVSTGLAAPTTAPPATH